MAQFKHNRFVMLVSLVATVVAATNGLSFITLMAGGITLLQFLAWKQQDAVRSRFKAVKDVFEALNVIAFDKRWVGSIATVAKVLNMLSKIDSKFVRSEQAIEFREQLAPRIFKLGYREFRFKEAASGDLPTVMIDGRKFNCVACIARAHGLDLVTVRRCIADTRKTAEKLTNDEWKFILSKKKGKGNPFIYQNRTYSNIAQFVVSISSTATLFTRKLKIGLMALTKNSGRQIIETCKRNDY